MPSSLKPEIPFDVSGGKDFLPSIIQKLGENPGGIPADTARVIDHMHEKIGAFNFSGIQGFPLERGTKDN